MRGAAWLKDALRRRKGALIYAALCALLLLSLRERTWEHLTTLNDEEWQPVQDFVRPQRQPDEPLCFLPSWTRGHAVDQFKFRGIDLIRSPEDAWEGDEPASGFWVVSQFGSFDPDDVPEDRYPHRAHRRLGAADIYLFRQEPIEELPESLVLRLQDATCLFHPASGRPVRLVWKRFGFFFDSSHPRAKSLNYLGCRVTHDRFGGRPRYGIWFHPAPEGNALSVTWPAVPLEQWLEVGGGFRDQVAGRGDPVKLQVVLDGRTLSTLTFPSRRGWKTFALRLASPEGEGRLSFKITAKRNHSRHFVFDARFSDRRPQGATVPGERPAPRAKRRPAASPRAKQHPLPSPASAESDGG